MTRSTPDFGRGDRRVRGAASSGDSSITTSERILDDAGSAVVEAEFGLVLWDPESRGSRPITDEERASLARAGEEGADEHAWNSDPVVLTVAVTGADVFRENNPNIPYTTEEIADSSIEAAGAGATVAHLHVREDDGTPSGRPELFKDVIERIRAGCDLLTMVSTGGANDMTIEERTTGPRGPARHLGRRVGLDELRRRDLHHAAAGRPRDHRAGDRAPGSRSRSRPSTSATWSARCAGWRRGSCRRRCGSTSCSASPAESMPSPEALAAMLRPLPRETFWTVTCIGRHHLRMVALALLHGAPGVRTGLEDVAYISRGVHAPSNAALVEMVVRARDDARPRGRHPGADQGAAAAWLNRRRHRRRPAGPSGRAAPARPRDP